MKILITGYLGNLGSALVNGLPQLFDNLSLVLIDRSAVSQEKKIHNFTTSISCVFVEGDLRQLPLDTIFTDVDVVIHLAAIADAAGSLINSTNMIENNFFTTQAVAQACLNNKVSLIFPSTTSVYGASHGEVDEKYHKIHPQTPYAECKRKEEQLLLDLVKTKGLKVAICRLATVYGVSRNINFHTAVSKFCGQAVEGKSLTVWETALDQVRPYLFINDAVRAVGWIIKHKLFNGEIYNIVTGNHTVREVVRFIKEDLPALEVEYIQHPGMNDFSYEVSADKFKKTGFRFEGSLKKGIHETILLLKNTIRQAKL